MIVEDLIKELEKFPKGTKVNLLDWRKNLRHDDGDGSYHGIHSKFDVSYENLEEDEIECYEDMHCRKYIPWIAISFENDDYDNDGKLTIDE